MSMQSPLGILADVLSQFNNMAINVATTLTRSGIQMVKSVDSAIPAPTAVIPNFGQGPRLPSPQTLFKPLTFAKGPTGAIFGASVAEEKRGTEEAAMF